MSSNMKGVGGHAYSALPTLRQLTSLKRPATVSKALWLLVAITFTGLCGMLYLSSGSDVLTGKTSSETSSSSTTSATTAQASAVDPTMGQVNKFANTHLFLRLTHHLPERKPFAKTYTPFFQSMTISMPDIPEVVVNGTVVEDGYQKSDLYYGGLGRQLAALKQHKHLTGFVQNHFDMLMVPNKFRNMSLLVPWLLDEHVDIPAATMLVREAPLRKPNWYYQDHPNDHHLRAYKAQQRIKQDHGDRFIFNVDCIAAAWADFYYVPASHFDDFAVLSQYFESEGVQHETAVASIMLIMISTRAYALGHHELVLDKPDACPGFGLFEQLKLIHRISDCWGYCCTPSRASPVEIASYRCGHPIDLRDQNLVNALYAQLRLTA